MDNVVELYADIGPEEVLEDAKGAGLATVVVLGVFPDGKMHLDGSVADMEEMLMIIKRAEYAIMRRVDELVGE